MRANNRSDSPTVALPNMSQLDPSILDALPEDVRAEILGFYTNNNNNNTKSPRKRQNDQSLLPHSPRKNRLIPPPNPKPITRRKRGGGLLASKFRAAQAGDNSTLTQSNFVARARPLADDGLATSADTTPEPEALDPEFLAALPEDIRREILDQQRQTRLQRIGGIDLSLHQQQRAKIAAQRKRKAKGELADEPPRSIILPPHPPKPTFTSAKFSSSPDLRAAIKGWYCEFCAEGPYGEDVEALARYLRCVVLEERDLGKAVGVVRWMGWVLEDAGGDVGEGGVGGGEVGSTAGEGAWAEALEKVREGVRGAVRERGLGAVDLG
jgi:DNA repair protein REV1